MIRWILKSLTSEPWHLVASVSAIGGAFALALFFEAVFAGESKQIVAYIDQSDADVWVMQRGVSNMHMATSYVSDWKADKIENIEGVNKVTPILYLNTVMQAGGRSWFSFIVGIESGNARAGPWSIAEGKQLPGPGEAIVPAVLARLAGLGVGDTISIAGHEFTVAGLSDGTFSMANSITFVTLADLADIMSTFASMSYFLVDVAPGVDSIALAKRVTSEIEKVNAVDNRHFTKNDREVAMQMGLEIIVLMTVIGGTLAILLTGFSVHSSVSRKEHEFAVMKALGVQNKMIYFCVMVYAIGLALLGFSLAVILVLVATPITASFVPQVTLQVTMPALLRFIVAALVVALLAAILPVRRIVRIDPVQAFKVS